MKVFKAIVGIALFLGVLFALVVALLYKLEIDRWDRFEKSFTAVVEGNSTESGKVAWQGKIIEYDNNTDVKERTILVQAFKFRRPAPENFRFYAINTGTFPLEVAVGNWVEIRGYPQGFMNGVPLLRSDMFDKWFYPFLDLGIMK